MGGGSVNRKRIHFKKSPLAGKTVKIKPETRHHLHREFGGRPFQVINWWDRTFKFSPYAMVQSVYSARLALCNLLHIPDDGHVLLGIIDNRFELVHISEIEQTPELLPVAA
jgi:hypothetical protein